MGSSGLTPVLQIAGWHPGNTKGTSGSTILGSGALAGAEHRAQPLAQAGFTSGGWQEGFANHLQAPVSSHLFEQLRIKNPPSLPRLYLKVFDRELIIRNNVAKQVKDLGSRFCISKEPQTPQPLLTQLQQPRGAQREEPQQQPGASSGEQRVQGPRGVGREKPLCRDSLVRVTA